ncbi:MAG: hypothetical protein PHP53_07315 [Prolixibacteraceae bacterium]|nr:hypothetical protein [Prolixibacteraceae bacterium]
MNEDEYLKYSKLLNLKVSSFEDENPEFLNEVASLLETGDKILNIINYIEKLRTVSDRMNAAIMYVWVLYRYCNREEYINVQQAYIDFKIDNKSGVIAENAVYNQKTFIQHLIHSGEINKLELKSILSDKKKKDILSGVERKSTKILKYNLKDIKNELINTDQSISNESKAQPVNNKPGRPKSTPKPVKEYIKNIDPEKIEAFLNALKSKFIESSPKDFIFMIRALYYKQLLNVNETCRKEVWMSFETFFGGEYGNPQNKYETWKKSSPIMPKGAENTTLNIIVNDISIIISALNNKIETVKLD